MKTTVLFKLWHDDEGQPTTELLATDMATKSNALFGWIWEDFDDMFYDWLTGTIGDAKIPEPGIYVAEIYAEEVTSQEGERDCDVYFEDLKPVYPSSVSGMAASGMAASGPGDCIECDIKFSPIGPTHLQGLHI